MNIANMCMLSHMYFSELVIYIHTHTFVMFYTCINLFNPHNHPMIWRLLITHFTDKKN